MDTNALTRAYLRIRDARAVGKKEWEIADAALKAKLDRLEAEMLRQLSAQNADSIKTEAGIFYRQEEIIPTGSDWQSFYAWVREHDAFDALERRIKKAFVKDHMEANNGAVPPGVSLYRSYVARVRRA